MPALGLSNTRLNLIPNLSTLFWWVDPFDYDGNRNSTLTLGAAVATGKVLNKAGSGGTATLPSGTGPTLVQSATGQYSWSHSGDKRLLWTFPSVAQPYLKVLIVKRTAQGANCDFCDGTGASNRSDFGENSVSPTGWMSMNGGAGLSTAGANDIGTITNKYNVIYGEFNGATSNLDFNFQKGPLGGWEATGNAGTQAVVGFTNGAVFSGIQPLVGEIVGGFAWSAPYPNAYAVWNMFTRLYQPGWPSTNMRPYQFRPQPTVTGAIKGADLVVFIGDSITAGVPGPTPWMSPLITSINSALSGLGGSAITTSNKGTAGNTVVQMAARFAADVIAQSPQSCFVQGGINDEFGRTQMDDYLTALRSMSTAWTGSGRAANKLIFCGPMCRGEEFPNVDGTYEAQIRCYSNAMNLVAVENGHPFVDMRQMHQVYVKANTTPPGVHSGALTSDSLHPNSTGCTQMSAAAFAKIAVAA